MAKHHIQATVNGDPAEFLCETEDTLLDVLRDTLDLTGSKEGCSSGDCGACSVMLDGRLVCSCLVLGCEVSGRKVETIEGLAKGESLHPLQRRFLEAAARAACRPIDDKRGTIEFRTDVAAVLTRRAALIALDRARTN